MLELFLEIISFAVLVHRTQTCVAKDNLTAQCFVHEESLADTATTIDGNELRLATGIKFLELVNLFLRPMISSIFFSVVPAITQLRLQS